VGVTEASVAVLWKEPSTAIGASRSRDRLSSELRHASQAEALKQRQWRDIAAEQNRHTRLVRRLQYLAHSLNSSTAAKKALGRIAIHRIGIDVVFVQGTGGSSLDLGPGHYTQTSLPGEGGTVGIAGHRTTYGACFRHIADLRRATGIVR